MQFSFSVSSGHGRWPGVGAELYCLFWRRPFQVILIQIIVIITTLLVSTVIAMTLFGELAREFSFAS